MSYTFENRSRYIGTINPHAAVGFVNDYYTRIFWVIYWEKARAAGLPVPAEFDTFYRWYEWMGVQRHLKVAGIFARLWYRDGKDKYRPEIPRFLNYLRRTTRRYTELAPLYALLLELVGDEELQTGYTF